MLKSSCLSIGAREGINIAMKALDTKEKLNAHNFRRLLREIKARDPNFKQEDIARWKGCDRSYITLLKQGYRGIGYETASWLIEFAKLYGIEIDHTYFLRPVGATTGRMVKVITDLRELTFSGELVMSSGQGDAQYALKIPKHLEIGRLMEGDYLLLSRAGAKLSNGDRVVFFDEDLDQVRLAVYHETDNHMIVLSCVSGLHSPTIIDKRILRDTYTIYKVVGMTSERSPV